MTNHIEIVMESCLQGVIEVQSSHVRNIFA